MKEVVKIDGKFFVYSSEKLEEFWQLNNYDEKERIFKNILNNEEFSYEELDYMDSDELEIYMEVGLVSPEQIEW